MTLLFREMRGAKFSCASPASAAVCTSIDRRSIVRSITNGRAIDRHTPHLRDSRRATNTLNLLTQTPSKPKSYSQKNRRSVEKPPEQLISPAGSTRYLLNDSAFFDVFPDLELVPAAPTDDRSPRFRTVKRDESEIISPSSSSSSEDQVVVLRVSLHCKGCEGKVRKHISKMEGVTSFNIDLAAKKVTVIGNVTPLGVLNSVSKVKSAQFWPSPPRSSASF